MKWIKVAKNITLEDVNKMLLDKMKSEGINTEPPTDEELKKQYDEYVKATKKYLDWYYSADVEIYGDIYDGILTFDEFKNEEIKKFYTNLMESYPHEVEPSKAKKLYKEWFYDEWEDEHNNPVSIIK